jgi:hypothetical protein
LGAAQLAELSEAGAKALGEKDDAAPVKYGSFKSQQALAQAKADHAYRKVSGSDLFSTGMKPVPGKGLYDNPDALLRMPSSPERSWGLYQMDGGYQTINDWLRDGKSTPMAGVAAMPQTMAENMVKAFDTMGYTTVKPGVLYRVVDGDRTRVGDLSPGGVFKDTGVVSCSASSTEVAGLLDPPQPGMGFDVDMRRENPILLKINVPAGTRVLGASPGGIETMLKPGTVMRVKKRTKKKTIGGFGEPGYGLYIGKHTLPMIEMDLAS